MAISRYNPLGTYRLTLTPRGENLTFELSLITENGVLNATGHGVVGVSSAQFNARLSADREHVAMNRLLELIGQKRVDGDQVFVEL